MPRESKILNVGALGADSVVHHYESFGWELLCLNGEQIAISRETKNPIYSQLVAYQAKYEAKLAEYNRLKLPKAPSAPEPFSFWAFLWRLFLLIIPGVVYAMKKGKAKREYETDTAIYEEELDKYNKTRDELLGEMTSIAAESRALFFGSDDVATEAPAAVDEAQDVNE